MDGAYMNFTVEVITLDEWKITHLVLRSGNNECEIVELKFRHQLFTTRIINSRKKL